MPLSTKRKNVEGAIQRALVRWIHETYPHIKVVATLNENNRHCMDMGCDDGITDLILFDRVDGVLHVFFHELKKLKGTLQPNQVDWEIDYVMRYASSNTHYAVGYGFEQSKKNVIDWQVQIH